MKTRNVTITLDEETARWARIEAARRDMSVSRLVGQLLREHMLFEQSYEEAMNSYLSRPGRRLRRRSTTRYPKRDELYDRGRLR